MHGPDWYDRQYNNRARIPEHPAILRQWADDSARALASHPPREHRYGDGAAETLDVYPARSPGAPVLVYLHGGYWRALGKRDQAFVAPPFVDAGAAVVIPDYALAPAVSVEHIVMQMVRAVAWTWHRAPSFGGDRGRLVVAGHSAGGHLAAMMLCCRWTDVDPRLPPQTVRSALAISGVFDLEPLRHAPFLAPDLGLTAASARRLSPLCMPAPAGPLAAVVGALESDEFRRQNQAIRSAWGATAVPICEAIPMRHHMSILADLADPDTRLHRLTLERLGLSAGHPVPR
jgi:arylformamidase